MQLSTYRVYASDMKNAEVVAKDFEGVGAMGAALAFMQECRQSGMRYVTMQSENPDCVSPDGVSAVEEGKLPNGTKYEWSKNYRIRKNRL